MTPVQAPGAETLASEDREAGSPGLRILMVAPQPFFRPRGTPFSVLQRIHGLRRLGHAVELATYPFGATPEVPGLVVHRSPRPPGVRDVAVGPSLGKLVLDVPLFRLALRLARSGRFDLVHTHEEAGFVGSWIRRRTGIPHLYDMHSSLPEQFAAFGRFDRAPVVSAFRRLERWTLEGADAVIAVCPELGRALEARGYTGPAAVIENCLDLDGSAPDRGAADGLRARLGVGEATTVVYTGTLEAYQGLELLVDAAAAVRARVPGVRFLVVGGTEAGSAGLRARAQAGGVAEAFVFVPAVPSEEVPTWLAMADVLVSPRTRGVNTPLKIYQYLRAGRPLVATEILSHTQVLDEGAAERVPPTAEGLAAGLARVLTDPARADALARGATRLASERYSDAAYLDALAGLLARIPGLPPAGREA